MITLSIGIAASVAAGRSACSFRPPFSRTYGGSAQDDATWRCTHCERWFVQQGLARQCEAEHGHESECEPTDGRRTLVASS